MAQVRTQGRRQNARGNRGGRRAGAEQKLAIRRREQEDSPRKQAARAEVEAERQRLERWMSQEQQGPAAGADLADMTRRALAAQAAVDDIIAKHVEQSCEEQGVPVKVTDPETIEKVAVLMSVPRPRHRYEPYVSDPLPGYTVTDALRMLEDGYPVPHIMRRTGVGYIHFEDYPLDEGGRLREA